VSSIPAADGTKISVRDLRLSYGPREVIKGISFDIPKNDVFAIIGPAQSGKSSLLRCLNRTIEFVPDARFTGRVEIEGQDVANLKNVYELRRRVGMVAPLPVGLPLSIYDNVAFAPRAAGYREKQGLDALVERCLRQAALWDEVKDRLHMLGTKLSGGQQQRLTIARALSHDPEILCLDEFSIAIDPVTTMRIEDALKELKKEMTIVLVTNLVQQARRLAGRTMFLMDGEQDGRDLFGQAEESEDVRLRERDFRMSLAARATPIHDIPRESGITTRDLCLWYADFQALKNVTVDIQRGLITSLIGPSGCGKTTLLRCFNRVNERYGYVRTTGEIKILKKNIYDEDVSLIELRKSVGMVFQRPNPLPVSVYENVVFGRRLHSERKDLKKSELDAAVEAALGEVGLWDDLKDRLDTKATELQLEQQQKLCIARLLPVKPEIILMDEPCSALDVEGTRAIEELMWVLRGRYTIVIVTHNMAQARRASDECIFMLLGEVIEHRRTEDLFLHPKDTRTAEYIEGRYG
jgi:phosphate transport system ATP-binding protein